MRWPWRRASTTWPAIFLFSKALMTDVAISSLSMLWLSVEYDARGGAPGGRSLQSWSSSPLPATSRRSTTASSRRSVTCCEACRVVRRLVIRTSSVARRRFSITTTSSRRVMIVVSPSCRIGTGASTQRSTGTRSTSTASVVRGWSMTFSLSRTTVLTRRPPVSFFRLRMTARSSTRGMTSRSYSSLSVTSVIPGGSRSRCCRAGRQPRLPA